METIHDAYLQIKDELLNSKAKLPKLTYINPDFKDLVGYAILREQVGVGQASD